MLAMQSQSTAGEMERSRRIEVFFSSFVASSFCPCFGFWPFWMQVSIYIELDGLDACTEDMFQAREH